MSTQYKGHKIPSGATMDIWKFIIDNPTKNRSACEKALKKKRNGITGSTFYTIRKKVVNGVSKSNYTPTSKPVDERTYGGKPSISNAIRTEVDKNPNITHKEFEAVAKQKVTTAHFSSTKLKHLNKSSSDVTTSIPKHRRGTNEILNTIDLDIYKNQEDLIMNLLTDSVLPAVSPKTEAVRLHTPNVIEIRRFTR